MDIKTVKDLNKLFYIVDNEIKPIELENIPDWAPVISCDFVEDKGKFLVRIDAYQRNGHIYARWEKEDLAGLKAYESKTAPFNIHLLIIDTDGNEEFCF